MGASKGLSDQMRELYALLLGRGYQKELFNYPEGLQSAKGGRETEATCPFCGKEDHFSFSTDKAL